MSIQYPHINLTNGNHLAFWHNGLEPPQISSLINYREAPDPSGDVFFALVDVHGDVGVPEILNYSTYHSQYNPVVQELSDGTFVVAVQLSDGILWLWPSKVLDGRHPLGV